MLRPTGAVVFLVPCLLLAASACTEPPAQAPPADVGGGWCAEHGVPESKCAICRPELASAPAHGTLVRLRGERTAERVGITTTPAEPAAQAAMEITAPARVVADPRRTARVHAPCPGVIREVTVVPGDPVVRGGVLARLDSAEVGAESAALRAARSRLDTADAEYVRARTLHDQGIVAQADLLDAKRDRDQAEADIAAARAALDVAGATDDHRGRYDLRAPLAGIVVGVEASTGRAVEPEDRLFEIVDTAAVVVEMEIAEADLPGVRAGSRATLEIAAYPGRAWQGTIVSVSPQLDPSTRTSVARMVLTNGDGALRPGAWGQARIETGGPAGLAWIPRGALQRARGKAVVFVESRPGLYEARLVSPSGSIGDRVLLGSGVRPGERVVVDGAYLLKTETLRDAIGAGCCD